MTSTLLSYIQIGLSVILVGLILLQYSDAGAGSAFGGGDNWNSAFKTRRGVEKGIFIFTIIVAIFFAVSAIAQLVI